MLDGGATGRDKKLNMCAKEIFCQNIVLHKVEDSHMSQYCTMLNVIQFLPKEMWKPQIVAYYKSSRLNHNIENFPTQLSSWNSLCNSLKITITYGSNVIQKSIAELDFTNKVSLFFSCHVCFKVVTLLKFLPPF